MTGDVQPLVSHRSPADKRSDVVDSQLLNLPQTGGPARKSFEVWKTPWPGQVNRPRWIDGTGHPPLEMSLRPHLGVAKPSSVTAVSNEGHTTSAQQAAQTWRKSTVELVTSPDKGLTERDKTTHKDDFGTAVTQNC
jgi:hypothetical protein